MPVKQLYRQFRFAALPQFVNNARSLTLQFLDYATGYRWKFYSPFVVFPHYKVVFLAVPRSGTTSIKYALTPLLGSGLDFDSPQYQHTFRHYIRSCTRRAAATRYADYFKFTFVRNPWTRLYSCYLAKIRSKSNLNLRHLGLDRCGTFEEFALRVCDVPDENADPHFMSQDYLLSFDGRFLPDRVYRFETYIEDWEDARRRIEQQTGIELSEIPHYYKMKSEDYRSEYSERLVDLVGERYRADCERFGYTYPG